MKSIAGIAVSGVGGVAGLSSSELSLPGLMSSRSLYSTSANGCFFVFGEKNGFLSKSVFINFLLIQFFYFVL